MFFCPHAADSACACRKPKPGMLLEVGERFNVPLKDPWSAMRTATSPAAPPPARSRSSCSPATGRKTRDEGNLPPGTEVFEDLAAFAEHLAP